MDGDEWNGGEEMEEEETNAVYDYHTMGRGHLIACKHSLFCTDFTIVFLRRLGSRLCANSRCTQERGFLLL